MPKNYRIMVYGSESYADVVRALTPNEHRLICEIAAALDENSAGDNFAPSMEITEVN